MEDFSEIIDDSEPAEDYDYYDDSDLEEGADTEDSTTRSTSTYSEHKGPSKRGKVIKIGDVAFITYVFLGSHPPTMSMVWQVPGLSALSIHR